MAGPSDSLVLQLPKAFLRSLEADLRGLCADARKRNPALKEEAERVILSLKEADSEESEADAADKAAAVFCSACEVSDVTAGSSSLSTQVKVALRAVSSLHKLLIHRAVYPSRLPEVLSALERLGDPSVDDNVTLKVLQGILSVLTIRGYAKSLREDEILRAFSLLFTVKSSRAIGPGHPASSAFAAVGSSGNDVGVIEQTAKAAFRQVTSDLFASAADAAVQTAVERKAPSSEFIAVALFPAEVRAAFNLFMDLINAAAGDALEWIPSSTSSRMASARLDVQLAVEVLDDNLASNIALFAGQPVFSEVLSARLCPVIHRLLKTVRERLTLRSLLSLVVSLIRHYWRTLQPDTEALVHALSKMSLEKLSEDRGECIWAPVYATEGLRCIFKKRANESYLVLDLVRAFDLRDRSGPCIGEAMHAAGQLMNRWKTGSINYVPHAALIGDLKPFMNTIKPTDDFCAAIATSFYCQVVEAGWEAINANDVDSARALMSGDNLELCIQAIERMIADVVSSRFGPQREERNDRSLIAYEVLVRSLGKTTIICDTSGLKSQRDLALSTMSTICSKSITTVFLDSSQKISQLETVDIAFSVLVDITLHCKESLGRSWLPILRAIERLDGFLYYREKALRIEALHGSTVFDTLKMRVKSVLDLPTHMSWKACHDMISAFVQCSRQYVASSSKEEDSEEVKSTRADPNHRIFGMECAESAFLKAIERSPSYKGPEPSSLWQLLSSHLTSICLDCSKYSLRVLALDSLTRVTCGIISSSAGTIPHNVVLSPFVDLLASSHADVCTGCINSMHVLLTSQGEQLSHPSAWNVLLQILGVAGGCKLPAFSTGDYAHGFEIPDAKFETFREAELVSEGFKVVQVIASDFLTSLSDSSILSWISLLRVYCLQNEDVNVALTAVGLLWRTADFLARSTNSASTESTWIALVVALKDISLEERPEVRKCAIKTLMGALSAHASRITPTVWNRCLKFALFPLLENVLLGGTTPAMEEPVTPKISSEVPLLLHHSRDTPRKQWNETRVLALSGVAEVLRISLPYMICDGHGDEDQHDAVGLEMKSSSWNDLLHTTCVAACSRDTEVAVSGVSALLDYLHSVGTSCDDYVPKSASWRSTERRSLQAESLTSNFANRYESTEITVDSRNSGAHPEVSVRHVQIQKSLNVMWESIWGALAVLLGCDESQNTEQTHADETQKVLTLVNPRAVLLLAEGLLTAWHDLRNKFSPRSSEILATIQIKLSLASSRNSGLEFDSADQRSQLQDAALTGLEDVATTGNADCRYAIICSVLQTLRDLHMASLVTAGKQATQAIRMVKLIFEQEDTPMDMRLRLMSRVTTVLKPIVLSGDAQAEPSTGPAHEDDSSPVEVIRASPLWTTALELFISVMRSVPADRFTGVHASLWMPCLMIVEEFVYAHTNKDSQKKAVGGMNEALSRKRETYAIILTNTAMQMLTRINSESSSDAKRFLLRLLTRGAEEGVTSGRPRFVHACQKMLFSAAEDGDTLGSTSSMSSQAAEFISCTCNRALRMFVADDQRAGRCPLPAKRREEIVFLLSQLILLNRKSCASRNHIVALYPRLCECVESREEVLRCLARQLLDEAAPSPSKDKRHTDVEQVSVEVK